MFQAELLQQRLAGLRFAHPLHFFPRIGSTNTEAKTLAEAGAPEGTLLVADEQLAGRGQGTRRWQTPPGTALAFSLILRPRLSPAHATRLTMWAGVAVCEAIEVISDLSATLKWPNDVLLNGKKVAGILVETTLDGNQLAYAVLGVGMNLLAAPDPHTVDFPATCLQAEAGRTINRLTMLRVVLERLEAGYLLVADDSLFTAWQKRLALLGEPLIARTAAGERTGHAVAVDREGALIFETDTGEQLRLISGLAQIRPA